MWCVLCIGIGDIVFHNGKRVFGQPQEAQPARRHAVSPQSTSTYICLCLYPCRLIFLVFFFILLFFTLCNRKCQANNVDQPTLQYQNAPQYKLKFFRFCKRTESSENSFETNEFLWDNLKKKPFRVYLKQSISIFNILNVLCKLLMKFERELD